MCLNISIFLVKIYCLEPPSPFWRSVYGNICLDLNVICTNVAVLGTTCDVTSWDDCISVRRMELVSSLWTWVIRLMTRARNSCTVLAVVSVVVK
jgi:hypothetical protein